MKKIKLFVTMILFSTLLTGCSVEYNITINSDTIKEEIVVNDVVKSTRTKEQILNHYNKWYPVYVNYRKTGESIPLPNFNKKVAGIEYYNKSINEMNNGYEYKYSYEHDIDNYYDAYALASTFVYTTVNNETNFISIHTSSESFFCRYDYFDNIEVNITIDPNYYTIDETNAKAVKNNTYSWIINKDDCESSKISLVIDKINNRSFGDKKNSNNSDFILYILCGIILMISLIVYFIIKIIKKKSNDFDIDD